MIDPPFSPCIPAMLRHMVEAHGDREALVGGARRLTFRQLEAESAVIARGLLAQNVTKSARVGILMPNSPDWAVVMLAVTRIGAIAVPISTLYQAPELRWVVRNADLHTLIVAPAYRRHDYVARLAEAFPSLAACTGPDLFIAEAPHLRAIDVWGACDRPWARCAPDTFVESAAAVGPDFLAATEATVVPADPMFMIYTSGSTAEPKGVVHTHGGPIRHSWRISHGYWLPGPQDRVASLRPYFWISGLSSTLLYALQCGACIVTPASESPADMLAVIREERVTAMTGSAGLFASVAHDPEVIASGFTVRRLTTDTAAVAHRPNAEAPYRFLNPEIEARRPAAAPDIPVHRMASTFGMTETLAGHTTLPALSLLPEGKEGSAGVALPGVTLKVVDPDSREELPAGQVGELLVRGYLLMDGLYKRERGEVFDADGYYATGDLCAIDADGFLTFKSRRGDMLKIKGANVAPLEVERVLASLPGVQEAAVVGLPQDHGMMLAAAVALLAGAVWEEAGMREALRSQLSSYKVPRRIFFIPSDALPRTGSGKVKKSALVGHLANLVASENPRRQSPSPTEPECS